MTTDVPTAAGAGRLRAGGRAPRSQALPSAAVAAVAFVIVTGETLPVGLITDVSRGLGATESQVGLAVGWYAMVAALTAVPLTRLTARYDRRTILVACAAVFGVAHVVAALATDLPLFLASRSIAAATHGLYFAVATPAVVRIARPEAKVRAGGRVAVGASSALVLGTPLATLLGQAAGWRVAMLAVTAVATVLGLALVRILPSLPAVHVDGHPSQRGVLATLRSRDLAVVLTVTVLLVVGHFALFTYVEPFAGRRLDTTGTAFSVLLLVYGLAAVAGSTLAGRVAERSPVWGLRWAAVTFAGATAGIWVAAQLGVRPLALALLVLWGGMFSLIAVSTGLAIVRRAPVAQSETAFALHGIVFQVGITAGSALGAAAYAAGRLPDLPLGAAAAGVAVLLALILAGGAFRSGTVEL